MRLLDLPLEIFRMIISEAVLAGETQSLLRLSYVCRRLPIFDELVEATFSNSRRIRIDGRIIEKNLWPWLRPYLERRLVEKRTAGLPRLDTIRTAAEYLTAADGSDANYETYALKLLHHNARSTRGFRELFLRVLLEQRHKTTPLTLLVAAILTGRSAAAPVESWDWTCDCTYCYRRCKPALGSKYEAAVTMRDGYAIDRLLLVDEGPRNVLRYAIKHADVQLVKRILPLVDVRDMWNGTSKNPNANPHTILRQEMLTTPSAEIFDLIIPELQYQRIYALDQRYLVNLLWNAAWNGWTDMARHLISRGAPLVLFLHKNSHHLFQGAPLEAASQEGHYDTVRLLLEHGATTMWEAESWCSSWDRGYYRQWTLYPLLKICAAREGRADVLQVPVNDMDGLELVARLPMP